MIDRIPVSQAAARKVQKMIQDGIFPVDQKLPSQRILAERLGISRPSLREALLTLETLGQIKTYPGRGTFVTKPGAQVAGGTAGWRYDTEHSLHSVFEMRILLEERLARHAATLATLEDITLLHSLADQMEAAWAQQDLVANVEADWAFHRHIASKTTNTLLAKTYEKFAALLTETQRTPIPFTHDARMSESIAEHRQIIAALNDRDADTAGRVMATHIRNTAARADVIV
ncbi:FadR/GntR family transcriptional regulator [Roseovarius dicentrarchi]|uniref:FadR/GntR family transcriptional regulator n=1 Tax=Roseovarius dicentrarchi TaxID=2250573 RepID=UPI000DE8084D|nr:FadR/GntR family transcriptional regulator [Roseovarius dicentrarchi]